MQINFQDGIRIEKHLNSNMRLKDIACSLKKDTDSISGFIRKYRLPKPIVDDFHLTRRIYRVSRLYDGYPFSSLDEYLSSSTCTKILRFPYCCNACGMCKKCEEPQVIFDALLADYYSQWIRSSSRSTPRSQDVEMVRQIFESTKWNEFKSIQEVYDSNKHHLKMSRATFYRMWDTLRLEKEESERNFR